MNSRRRIFFGLPLSAPLSKSLARFTAPLPREVFLAVRPENLHVTLYYVGFVLQDEIQKMSEGVREALSGVKSFEMAFEKIEYAPDAANPKMIFLSGKPNPELLKTQEAIEKVFSPYLAEKKSFRPHVTLARIRRPQWQKLELKPAVEKAVSYSEAVDVVHLYESVVIDGKRQYEVIDTYPLE